MPAVHYKITTLNSFHSHLPNFNMNPKCDSTHHSKDWTTSENKLSDISNSNLEFIDLLRH